MTTASNDDARRIREAEANQARILAMLPDFPEYGFYVKTGLTGYGPDLDEGDYPVRDGWEALADAIGSELAEAADFTFEGASIAGDAADGYYSHDPEASLESYREAWHGFKLSEELRTLAANFDNRRKDAPLYAGRPALWHATIYNLISEHFPLDISHNSRLYVWEAEEDPGDPEE